MGFLLTLLFLFTSYLTPVFLFGELGRYNLLQFVAVITLLASLVHVKDAAFFDSPQSYGALALTVCVGLSLIFNVSISSMPMGMQNLTVSSIVFFFIVLNVRTRSQIQVVVALLMVVAVFAVFEGYRAVATGDATSPWVYMMGYGEGLKIYRINALGYLNDPNDFCQFLVGLIPCAFIFWRAGKFAFNLVFVLLPVSFLLYGMFLTHSRGGMLALLAAMMVAGRRKLGILPSVITGGVLFAVLSAVGWSGGREISAESGSDRTEAWSTGLVLIRTHPFFGVGYQRFAEFYPITAHNTVVVCAAELGFIGFFFWIMMVAPSFLGLADAVRLPEDQASEELASTPRGRQPLGRISAGRASVARALPAMLRSPAQRLAFATSTPGDAPGSETLSLTRPMPGRPFSPTRTPVPAVEVRRICNLMMISLTGFFTAGWFLSRAYSTVFFTFAGLAVAVHRLAVDNGISARLPLPKAFKVSGIVSVTLIAAVYLLLRVTNLLPK